MVDAVLDRGNIRIRLEYKIIRPALVIRFPEANIQVAPSVPAEGVEPIDAFRKVRACVVGATVVLDSTLVHFGRRGGVGQHPEFPDEPFSFASRVGRFDFSADFA